MAYHCGGARALVEACEPWWRRAGFGGGVRALVEACGLWWRRAGFGQGVRAWLEACGLGWAGGVWARLVALGLGSAVVITNKWSPAPHKTRNPASPWCIQNNWAPPRRGSHKQLGPRPNVAQTNKGTRPVSLKSEILVHAPACSEVKFGATPRLAHIRNSGARPVLLRNEIWGHAPACSDQIFWGTPRLAQK